MKAAHAISPADEYGLGERRQTLAIIEASAVCPSVSTYPAELGDAREHTLANLLNQHRASNAQLPRTDRILEIGIPCDGVHDLHGHVLEGDQISRGERLRACRDAPHLWSARTLRPSGRAGREAVLVVKSVQDGVRHYAAAPVEAMPLALQLHGAMLVWNEKTGS
jgi:hypothetical protein